MRIQIINGNILVLEAPKTSGLKSINKNILTLEHEYWIEENILLPQGNWQLLGRLPEISEEQLYPLFYHDIEISVEQLESPFYNAYKTTTKRLSHVDTLNSMLKSNEVYFENPLGEEQPNYGFYNWGLAYEDIRNKKRFERDFQDWQEAQSKVWDKDRTFLFIKVD